MQVNHLNDNYFLFLLLLIYFVLIGKVMWEEFEWKLCYFHVIMNVKNKLKALGVSKETYFFYFGVLKEMKEQKDEKQAKNIWENFQTTVTCPKGKLWFGF